MIPTMTKPITSSIMAAVMRIVPIFVEFRFAADRIVNVVPKDVDDKATPAAKAFNGSTLVGENIGISRNESAMGNMTPVIEMKRAGTIELLSKRRSVESPPAIISFQK